MTKIEIDRDVKQNVKRIPLYGDEPSNLADLFTYAAEKRPRDNALNFKRNGKWRSVSTADMISRIENVTLGLYALGIRAGDRIAILAANSPEWTIVDAGCQYGGIVDVPIYTTLNSNLIRYIVNDSGAKVFFVENSERLAGIEGILAELPTVEKIVLFDDDGGERGDLLSLGQLEESGASLRRERPELIKELVAGINPDDVATLIYTSGTTGEPKGVMLSHQNLLSNIIDAGEKFSFSAEDVPLSVLPLSHVFERTGMYLYLYNGMAVHYAESVEKVAENLTEVCPTIFVGVPRIFEKVYAKAKLAAAKESRAKEMVFDWAIDVGKEHALKNESDDPVTTALALKHSIADKLVFAKLRQFFGGRLRFCITGGAALSDSIYLIFTGAGISIMQGYGLTETSPVISSNNPVNFRLGTVGKPIRNVQVRIAGDGEIEVTGPNVMLGYYGKPQATKDSFSADGWFKTGDIGELDKDNFLRITDRKKELFKTSGGKYIAPSPIEQMIKESRYVNQVVLIGNARKFASALIVPDFEQLENFVLAESIVANSPGELCSHPEILKLFEEEIDKYCSGLSQFETVKKVILLENELTVEGGELTPTLKIKRRIIDEKYAAKIEKVYLRAETEKPAS